MVLGFDMLVVMSVDMFPSVGPAGGQTEGDVQADAGAAAAGREVPQADGDGAGQREAQTRRLHGQERRLHKPAGAGKGEVTFSLNQKVSFFLFKLL